jgi:hypothetical protein
MLIFVIVRDKRGDLEKRTGLRRRQASCDDGNIPGSEGVGI